MWVPAHVGIRGNELADESAKAASEMFPLPLCPVAPSDIKSSVKKSFRDKSLEKWLEVRSSNKLRNICGDWDPTFWELLKKRKEQVIYCRLRIGHCKLTHSHLFKKLEPRTCTACNCVLSVEHIFVSCPVYATMREAVGLPSSLKDVFSTDRASIQKLFNFINLLGISNEI